MAKALRVDNDTKSSYILGMYLCYWWQHLHSVFVKITCTCTWWWHRYHCIHIKCLIHADLKIYMHICEYNNFTIATILCICMDKLLMFHQHDSINEWCMCIIYVIIEYLNVLFAWLLWHACNNYFVLYSRAHIPCTCIMFI